MCICICICCCYCCCHCCGAGKQILDHRYDLIKDAISSGSVDESKAVGKWIRELELVMSMCMIFLACICMYITMCVRFVGPVVD